MNIATAPMPAPIAWRVMKKLTLPNSCKPIAKLAL